MPRILPCVNQDDSCCAPMGFQHRPDFDSLPLLSEDLRKRIYSLFVSRYNENIDLQKKILEGRENNAGISAKDIRLFAKDVGLSAKDYLDQYGLLQCLFRAVFGFLHNTELQGISSDGASLEFCLWLFNDDAQFISSQALRGLESPKVQRAMLARPLHSFGREKMSLINVQMDRFIDLYDKKKYSEEEYCPGGSSELARAFDDIMQNIGNLAQSLRLAIFNDIRNKKDPTGRNGVFKYEYKVPCSGSFRMHVVTLGRNPAAISGGSDRSLDGNSTVQKKEKSQILSSWADALFCAFNYGAEFYFNKESHDKVLRDKQISDRLRRTGTVADYENVVPAKQDVQDYGLTEVDQHRHPTTSKRDKLQELQSRIFADDKEIDDRFVQNNRFSEQHERTGTVADYENVVPAKQDVQDYGLTEVDWKDEDLDGIFIPPHGTQNPEESLAVARKMQSKENLRAIALGGNIEPIEQDDRSMTVSNCVSNNLRNKNNAQFDYKQAIPPTQLSALRIIGAQNQERSNFTEQLLD